MSLDIQKQIKDNSRAVSDYFSDLVRWEEEENKKEKRREAKAAGIRPDTVTKPEKAVPPPRGGEAEVHKDGTAGSSEEPIARDKLKMPQYYHNWDQFDAEAEVDALDQAEDDKQRQARQQKQAEKDRILDEMSWKGDGDRVRTSKARPRVKVNIRARGRRPAPVDLAKPKKEEANNYFAQGRFKEAMVAYSAALDYLEKYEPPGSQSQEASAENGGGASVSAVQSSSETGGNEVASASADGAGEESEAVDLKVTLLANRAQALIKIEEWQEAIFDCSEALRFKPQHHKAILRRGFALTKQKRWSAAARDLEVAVANDPQDRKAAAELQMARRNLAEQAKEVRAHAKAIMCDSTRETTMPTRKLAVKVCRPGETAAGPGTSAAKSSSSFQPQPRGARGVGGTNQDILDEIEADKPVAAAATASKAAPRQPYVPRSVRMRGRQQVPAASQASASAPSAAADVMNFYTFEAHWTRHRQKPSERCSLLRQVGAAALPALFRESLDAELVASIISVLSFELGREAEGAASFAFSVMGALSRTNRFDLSLGLLSEEERSVCMEVLSKLERRPADCAEDLAALRRAFEPAAPLPFLPDENDEEDDEDDVPLRGEAPSEFPLTSLGAMAQDVSVQPASLAPPETVGGVAEFSLDGCD